MMGTEEFYDEYVERQVTVGINDRHRAIREWLARAGLRRDHRVLEIGCGVGTLTQLMLGTLGREGSVTAIDLSPRSIEAARRRLTRFGNVHLITGDVLTAEIDGPFDVVVLPDVIEHIPLEAHTALFSRVAGWLANDGFALLNYPNPHYLQWCYDHTPEVLQPVDQPIHADTLTAHVYRCGLYLDRLETYSVWVREHDYVVAVLRSTAGVGDFTRLPGPSLVGRVREGIRRRLE